MKNVEEHVHELGRTCDNHEVISFEQWKIRAWSPWAHNYCHSHVLELLAHQGATSF